MASMLAITVLGLPIAMSIVGVLLALVSNSGVLGDQSTITICAAIWIALAGAMVFLPDQSRRQYRFFTEHNVPPRLVWFTRLAGWAIVLPPIVGISTIVAYQLGWPHFVSYLPLLVVPFAIGQWCSMFIRSGIMAGFVSVTLSAVAAGWVLMMLKLQVPLWFSVFPIPVLLFFATWLRAPDWIRENTTWRARIRAASTSILGPAIVLAAVPVFRVQQIPEMNPGFDTATYLVGLRADLHAGQIGADLYRAAGDAVVRPDSELSFSRPFTEAQSKWLTDNADALKLTLRAAEQPACLLADPATATQQPRFRNAPLLIDLLMVSAYKLESERKLEDALQRYLTAMHASGQLAPADPGAMWQIKWIFRELTRWAALPNQTPQMVRKAREQLQALKPEMLHIDDRSKFDYLLARKSFLAGEGMLPFRQTLHDNEKAQLGFELLWGKLFPWENHRAVRALNMVTADDFAALKLTQDILKNQETEDPGPMLASLLSPVRYTLRVRADVPHERMSEAEKKVLERRNWLETTIPSFTQYDTFGFRYQAELAEFETSRRGTILVLALQEYRLDRGELPPTLDELVPNYFATLPDDPYSGMKYRYFPKGLPIDEGEVISSIRGFTDNQVNGAFGAMSADELNAPVTKRQIAEELDRLSHSTQLELNQPCLWCTGPYLWARTESVQVEPPDGGPAKTVDKIVYHGVNWYDGQSYPISPEYAVWGRGYVFPVPPEKSTGEQTETAEP